MAALKEVVLEHIERLNVAYRVWCGGVSGDGYRRFVVSYVSLVVRGCAGCVCSVAALRRCREGEMRRSRVDHVTDDVKHCVKKLRLRSHLSAVLYAACASRYARATLRGNLCGLLRRLLCWLCSLKSQEGVSPKCISSSTHEIV